ncbi:hypothetical protein BST95_16280 [Halioglobus japonicus]|uniref:PhzF family phenazine biosynthesis protein n=1 Tax=Halioglobus japonicus TaxID=930805 RepID=A0AAP8MGI3_9GAMM|nr:PhzF family phenazine biosynthesis protein [Halioglobus japonicus]AQA19560.1 hypothetical protein BST95_16280 [Halioglobus japonicus]PLW87372.1 PhzF family phenazine biosynthesis protein [Halioglobus japonicus]GHD08817.1 hypothetical protein GCM10007052_06130 [Halioglobus japonicus]
MRLYQVFHELPQRQGNLASVTTSAAAHDRRANTELPTCVATTSGNARFHVSCEQHNREIQCCGHGLLATAHELLDTQALTRAELGNGVWAQREPNPTGGSTLWLYLPELIAATTRIPAWTDTLARDSSNRAIAPKAAAATANADGYLLLELPAEHDLGELSVDIETISHHTRRAVLLWQSDSANPTVVRVRYFAPQYGNDEDGATGSVLRVLIPHLHTLSNIAVFDVIQCSPTGGRMTARKTDDSVAISGNIRLVDDKDLPTPWQA